MVLEVPPIKGSEYLDVLMLEKFWNQLDTVFRKRINVFPGGAAAFFEAKGLSWHLVGRVTFHLAENRRDEKKPFAFLATYSSGISATSKVQHLPLGRAIEEYSGAKNHSALLRLLQPVQEAAGKSKLIRDLVDSGKIYHPQSWKIEEAYQFLREIPTLEQCGLQIRVPNWWKPATPPRPSVRVILGGKKESLMGAGSLLDFDVQLSIDGEEITPEEWKKIQSTAQGLVFLKGRWVEVDKGRLDELLAHWKKVESSEKGITFLQGLRMISGASIGRGDLSEGGATEWTKIEAGTWLESLLNQMRDPAEVKSLEKISGLEAELRPYQKKGVAWLWLMHRLGLGACLADDMGLGKTIQILAFLIHLKKQGGVSMPSLLVAPASLLGNWQAEASRFTPSLRVKIVHPSQSGFDGVKALPEGIDLVVTTYGMLSRQEWLLEQKWAVAILDEAQAIKNSSSIQSKMVKRLQASTRIALTGTPVENSLGDLWSLFDFVSPGLLGNSREFSDFIKRQTSSPKHFAPLRNLTRPYLLRRLKTDPKVISDLPEKTEIKTFCSLSKKQAILYKQAVEELGTLLEEVDGVKRRGILFAFLTRFKQICNHPDHWTSSGEFEKKESGKFLRLEELISEIASRQEKVLVFTQFKEMVAPLNRFLAGIFQRTGLTLDGTTAIGERKKRVAEFQREEGPPFFVLSLKAGGVGLNLTEASHVIHFDRWWNPAVENQATDRAFRIGQKRKVMVHKFVCQGTIESRIDQLIDEKKNLAEEITGGGAEKILTEMDNDEILRFVSLDLKSAVAE